MKHNLLIQIEFLNQRIDNTDITIEAKDTIEWGGADVIINNTLDNNIKEWLKEQPLEPLVVSYQSTVPRRRAVITQYSKELSWLFYQIKQIFSEEIDYVSKYDFYGSLAQSANDFLANNQQSQGVNDLLFAVLKTSKKFCDGELSK